VGDHADKPPDNPSEVLLLQHDVLLIHDACQQLARERVIEAKAGEGRFYRIAGDLWQKHVNHCQGVALLLGQGLFDSAVVVNRAAYETAITLTYLRRVGDRHRNAALFEAQMVVDTAMVLTDEDGGIASKAPKAIEAIPEDILKKVRENRKARRPWSGKTIAEMAEAINVTGHKATYAIMSWPAHARFAGQGIEKMQHLDGNLEWRFGSFARPVDFEGLANHTRRMMHRMYFAVTTDFYGVTLPLATIRPFARNEPESEGRTTEKPEA
jgi:Family of unknown function (DUF5677)